MVLLSLTFVWIKLNIDEGHLQCISQKNYHHSYQPMVSFFRIWLINNQPHHMLCTCDEFFFFFFLGLMSLLFIYLINFLDKFFLKIWISRNVPYFVGILSEIGEIFLLGCSQVFSQLNVRFKGIFEPHKSLIQSGESSYQYKCVLRCSFIFLGKG